MAAELLWFPVGDRPGYLHAQLGALLSALTVHFRDIRDITS
jgi:hypothetical protein